MSATQQPRPAAGKLPRQASDLALLVPEDHSSWPDLVSTLADVAAAKKALKQAKNSKNAVQRQVGDLRKAKESVPPELQQQMSVAAADLKTATQTLRTAEEQLQAGIHSAQGSGTTAINNQQPDPARGLEQQPPAEPVAIEQLTALDDAWQDYAAQHPAATAYHQPNWLQMLQQVFNHQALYLAANDASGRRVGILPLIRQRSRLFGDFTSSVPFGNYGGALADTPAVHQALTAAAGDWAASVGTGHLELRDTSTQPDWPCRTDKVCMLRPLPASAAALDEELGSNVRAQVRKALRFEPVAIITDGTAMLDDFYRVYAENMRDLGTPPYHKGFFRAVLEACPGQARLAVLRYGDDVVSCALLLRWRDTLEIPWAATLRRANQRNANMALYWHVLCHAIQIGCTSFDFGRSTRDAGTYRFKKQWGAEPRQLYWHYWLPEGAELPKLNPDNPKYQLAIRAWQHLPVWATRLLGPHLVSNLP